MMPVLPEEITTASLRRRWRGYHPAQVEALLNRIATDYSGALDRIATLAEDRARYQADQQQLQRRLDGIGDSARETAEQARRDADTDAEKIRARAERAAALIISQAEEAAGACARHAHTLRADAEQEASTAQRRLAEADRRAPQLEDAARDRCETMRVETEKRFEHLQIAERRFAERIHNVEEILAAVRTEFQPGPPPTHDGDHTNGRQLPRPDKGTGAARTDAQQG
jgi:DivIVA domain-containing protein